MKTAKLSLLLAVCFLLLCTISAAASGDLAPRSEPSTVTVEPSGAAWVLMEDENGEPYLYNEAEDLRIIKAGRLDENGIFYEIPITQELAELNDRAQEVELIPSGSEPGEAGQTRIATVDYFCEEETNYRINGTQVKLTPDVMAQYADVTPIVSAAFSFSESFGINAGAADAKSAIRASAGFTWSASATFQSGYTIPVTIPQGKIGYIAFTPYYNYTEGDLTKLTYNEYGLVGNETMHVTGQSPVTLPSGTPDGVYQVVITGSC